MLQGNQGPLLTLLFSLAKEFNKVIKNRILDYPSEENNNLFFKRLKSSYVVGCLSLSLPPSPFISTAEIIDKLVFRSLVPFQFHEMWDISHLCEISSIVMGNFYSRSRICCKAHIISSMPGINVETSCHLFIAPF